MSFSDIDKLKSELDIIDDKQRLVTELKTSCPLLYSRWFDYFLVESTYDSNKIEGSTLTKDQTKDVFNGKDVFADQEYVYQAQGGFEASQSLLKSLKNHEELSEQLIKSVHKALYKEALNSKTQGVYRVGEVEITGTDYLPVAASDVADAMVVLVKTTLLAKRHPVVVAALFHLEFESIHPFVNANGRTGRMIANYILMSKGYEPLNIQAHDRDTYIKTLKAYQVDDDPYPFTKFFIETLNNQLNALLAYFQNPSLFGDIEVKTGRYDNTQISDYLTGIDVGVNGHLEAGGQLE